MFGILKIKLIEAIRSLQHTCTTAVRRDDDGDDGDIAPPKTCIDDNMQKTPLTGRCRAATTSAMFGN
jgi:hypothetical protein